jgi:peptidyl-prolyl cis-trans isomerase D
MASLNTLKTKFGFLISGLIAVVLVIFALNIDSNTFVDQPTDEEINGPTVFTIADQEVKHSEYARLRDLYSQLQTINYMRQVVNFGHEQGAAMAFQTLMFNKFLAPAYETVGVLVTEAEVQNYITAQYAEVRAQYAEAGFPAEQIDMILSIYWGSDMYFAMQQLANQKSIDIMSAGLYLNKLEVAQALRQDKLTFDGSYVEIPYTAIADEEVEVTDEEVQAYYEAHRKENAKMGSRTIRYVRFDRQATEQDKKAIEDEVMALDAKVAEAANADAIKNAVRAAGGKVQSYYTAYESLQPEVAEAFKAGEGYGPVVTNNVWTARYLISDITAPESFDVEVATYADLAAAEKAVEELKANGGDFKKLQEATEVNAQTILFTQMPVSDTKHFVGRAAGDIFAFNTSGVATVVKINAVGAQKRYVLTANLDRQIVPSDDTNRAVLALIDEFSSKMGNTNETFTEAAQAVSKSPLAATVSRVDVFSKTPAMVQGIANSANMAHWATGAEVGESKQFVIDGVTYVALVVSIDNEEFEALNDAAIRRQIAQDKKYAMLQEKVKSLEDAKAYEGAKAETFAGVKYADNNLDAHLIGAIAATTEVDKAQMVQGTRSAYIFVVNKINGEVDPATYAEERIPLTEKTKTLYENSLYMSFMRKADVKDHRDDTTF